MPIKPLPSILFATAMALAAPVRAATCPAPAPGAQDTWRGEQAWRALARAGYRFGAIEYQVEDVYGSDADEPDAWYARTLNFLHIESRPATIAPHLLFETGAPVDAELVHQTERRLRRLRFLREAEIVPVACADGVVSVRVTTRDAWTLNFGLDYKSVGGESRSGFSLSDANFLGSGKTVFLRRRSDALRDTNAIGYYDPALRDSRWTLGVEHQSLSDGSTNSIALQRPFATHEELWAMRLAAEATRQTLSFHDQGEVAWRTRTRLEVREIGMSRLLEWTGDEGWRAGLAWREEINDYGALEAVDPALRPPPTLADRERRGLVLSLSRFHDHWETFRDLRTISRTEDINLGLDGTLALGYYPGIFTATTPSWTARLSADWAGRLGDEAMLIASLDSGLRLESGGITRDGRFDLSAALYWVRTAGHSRVAQLALRSRYRPDPENELYLGGSDGLLGYPTHFVAADRVWTTHFAERWVTDRVWFQTLQVGWNVFLEVGRGRQIGGRGWSPLLADIGGGLRLGNLRGSDDEAIFLSVAVPLRRDPGVDAYSLVLGVVLDY